MRFLKKQDAINYYNKSSNNKTLRLFAEDIDKTGTKCFYVSDTKYIFNKIEKLEQPHFYELWTDKEKILFAVDIDYNRNKDIIEPDNLLKKIIKIVIDGAKEYYDYEYRIRDIIILENDINEEKYSAHIIFRGLNFNNYLVAKDFYTRLDKDYEISKLHVDKSIYKPGCFRLYLNSKMGKNIILVPKQIKIKNEYTLIPNRGSKDEFYEFFLKTMITNTNKSDKIIKEIKYKKIIKEQENSSDISNINIEYILEKLPSKYYDDWHTWTKIGMILYNYDKYDLWNSWSSKSHKYKEHEMISKWNSFASSKDKISIGTLIHYAKEENIENIYKNNVLTIEDKVKSYPIKQIKLDISKLNNNQLTILSQPKLEPKIYRPLLNKKLIAVQSEKGTGKTSNLLEVLFEDKNNENKNILFISSRVTFGYKLLGDLKDKGFQLYSQIKDNNIYSKRIICQIDSITRLKYEYDIIIVDECETLARYITSQHFTKNQKAKYIIETFVYNIKHADNVFILDADLSDRCINFYKKNIELNNDDFHLVLNNYRPYKDYKILYCNYPSWLRQILIKLEHNKKLVIAMTSISKAKDLNILLKDNGYNNILLIHRESSDEIKQKIFKVNEEWIKYDIVIYTPSVCMGVSFDITDHFDYIFAYGCHESLGAQEWCQMIHRVRSPNNREIYLTIDNYKEYDEKEDTIDYKTVEKILCSDYYLSYYDLHNNIIDKKVKKVKSNLDNGIEDDETVIGTVSENDKIIVYPYKNDPIYDLYVRNSLEIIENRLNFPACFFGYTKYKEYQLEYLPVDENDNDVNELIKDIRKVREEEEKNKLVKGICDAEDITQEQFLEKIKLRDEYLEEKDIYEIKRYNFRNCYDIPPPENIDSLIEKYYDSNKMKWYRNLSTVLSTEIDTTEKKLQKLKDNYIFELSDCYQDFSKKNKYQYHNYPLEIIKIFNFDINDLSREISEKITETDTKTYTDKINEVISYCSENKEALAFKYSLRLLRYINTREKTIDERFRYREDLKCINDILKSQYGLKIIRSYTDNDCADNNRYKLTIINEEKKKDENEKQLKNIWEDLPDKSDIDGLKRKIKSLNIKLRKERDNDYDTKNLDLFIDNNYD